MLRASRTQLCPTLLQAWNVAYSTFPEVFLDNSRARANVLTYWAMASAMCGQGLYQFESAR